VYAWGSFRDASGLWCFVPGTKIQPRPTLVRYPPNLPRNSKHELERRRHQREFDHPLREKGVEGGETGLFST
jgi:hypothetical protein